MAHTACIEVAAICGQTPTPRQTRSASLFVSKTARGGYPRDSITADSRPIVAAFRGPLSYSALRADMGTPRWGGDEVAAHHAFDLLVEFAGDRLASEDRRKGGFAQRLRSGGQPNLGAPSRV